MTQLSLLPPLGEPTIAALGADPSVIREGEPRLATIMDAIPDAITVADDQWRVVLLNAKAAAMVGRRKARSLYGASIIEMWPVAERTRIVALLKAVQTTGQPKQIEQRLRAAGEFGRYWRLTFHRTPALPGCRCGILLVGEDITVERQANQDLEEARGRALANAERLSAVLDSTTDSICVVGDDRCITYMNANAAALLGRIGIGYGDQVTQLLSVDTVREIRALGVTAGRRPTVECWSEPLQLWLELRSFHGENGVTVFFRDITARRAAEAERLATEARIDHMVRHDALTGLGNRRLFFERLERLLDHPETCSRTTVLYLDLDGFKLINDTLGHIAGDRLLCLVAERLLIAAPAGSSVLRVGADEFAVLCCDGADDAELRDLAARLLTCVTDSYDLGARAMIVGATIGIAQAEGSIDAATLHMRAEIALQAAKAHGSGGISAFQPGMDEVLRSRQALKLDLAGVTDRGELVLFYQAIVDLRELRVTGFEALLRWQHPQRGLISPVEFIPLAEQSGCIIAIGAWVLEQACRQAATWPNDLTVAVNLSPVQFWSRTELVERVRVALEVSGLAPSRLELEITESVLLQDNDGNIATLHALQQLGVHIAMDDFGTGYAALSYLQRFPFDTIKLDRSFVSDLPDGAQNRAIVRAVSSLGADLPVGTTAEGIETMEQLAALRHYGFRHGQGFLFGTPQAAEEVELTMARVAALVPRVPALDHVHV